MPSATQRKIWAEGEKKTTEHDALHCLGVAVVVSSTILRGAVTAVFWLVPPRYPTKFCKDIGEAGAWLEGLSREWHQAGEPLPVRTLK